MDSWVRVRAEREGHSATLYLDGEEVGQAVADMESTLSLASVTDLYFGGYPGSDYREILDTGFHGCIRNMLITPDAIDNAVITSEAATKVGNTA